MRYSLQLGEFVVGSVRFGEAIGTVHIRVGEGGVRSVSAAHSGMSIRPFAQCTASVIAGHSSNSVSHVREHIFCRLAALAVGASRERRALVLDDFLKYIMKDGLGIVRVVDLAAHAEDVTALLDVVLDVIVSALVSELGHFYLFACELLIEVVKIERRRRQLLQTRREYGSLKGGHRRLELGRDQGERLMLHTESLVQLEALRDQISVELVKILIEERREVLGQLIGLLETTA